VLDWVDARAAEHVEAVGASGEGAPHVAVEVAAGEEVRVEVVAAEHHPVRVAAEQGREGGEVAGRRALPNQDPQAGR